MNFKQLKNFDFKNIDINRNQFEHITVGLIILCALSLLLVTIKRNILLKLMGLKSPIRSDAEPSFKRSRNSDL